MMKRWMFMFVLTCLCLAVQICAADEPSITMTSEGGVVGEVMEVYVWIEDNPGLLSFSMTLAYDEDVLTPVSYVTPAMGFAPGATYNAAYDEGVLSYFCQADYSLIAQGEVVMFEFEVLSATENGYSALQMDTFAGNPTLVLEDGAYVNYDSLPGVQVTIYEVAPETEEDMDTGICLTCNDDIHITTDGGISLITNTQLPYIQGYEDGTFAPEANITRAEAGVMLSRLLTPSMVSGRTYEVDFTDVNSWDWYANTLGYLSNYGVIVSYEDGSFAPDVAITRAEFAEFICNIAPMVVSVSQQFEDVDDSHWSAYAINYGAYMGWWSGYEDRTFQPDQPITRAEAVCIVNRVLGRAVDGAIVETGFSDVPTSHWASQEIRIATQGIVTQTDIEIS